MQQTVIHAFPDDLSESFVSVGNFKTLTNTARRVKLKKTKGLNGNQTQAVIANF
jgi:hypothetical protein